MEQTTLRDELSLIRGLMEQSQRLLCGSWKHQAAWGLLTAAGLFITWWAVEARSLAVVAWLWPVLLAVGWAFSLWIGRRESGRAQVHNAAGRAFTGIWVGAGITLTLVGTVGLYGDAFSPRALPGLLPLIVGLGYFATGAVAGWRWLLGLGVVWWVAGSVLLVWRGAWALPALAVLVLLFQVGPALILRRHTAPSQA